MALIQVINFLVSFVFLFKCIEGSFGKDRSSVVPDKLFLYAFKDGIQNIKIMFLSELNNIPFDPVRKKIKRTGMKNRFASAIRHTI